MGPARRPVRSRGRLSPAIFVGTIGGLLASHLPGFPQGAAVGVVMAATIAAVLRLPLAAVVIALLLTTNTGIEVTPLIIIASEVSYVLVDVLETAFARSAPGLVASAIS